MLQHDNHDDVCHDGHDVSIHDDDHDDHDHDVSSLIVRVKNVIIVDHKSLITNHDVHDACVLERK